MSEKREKRHERASQRDGEEGGEREKRRRRRGPIDDQMRSISKLMANPDKPVPIPEKPKERKPADPQEFVGFYMGSSAGAGSEVYHVYRHLRKREMARQSYIKRSAVKEEKDAEWQHRALEKKMADEARTSKKRAKRLKRKLNQQQKKKAAKAVQAGSKEEEEEEGGGGGSPGKDDNDVTLREGAGGEGGQRSGSDSECDVMDEAHFVIGGK